MTFMSLSDLHEFLIFGLLLLQNTSGSYSSLPNTRHHHSAQASHSTAQHF